jgi:hypothetical protein
VNNEKLERKKVLLVLFLLLIEPRRFMGVGYGRIRIICVGSDTVFVGFLSGGFRAGSKRE